MVGKHITQHLSKPQLFILIKLDTFLHSIYMDLFYFKKFQRKKTANRQTQDVGFHVKTLGLSERYCGEPVSQACQAEHTTG